MSTKVLALRLELKLWKWMSMSNGHGPNPLLDVNVLAPTNFHLPPSVCIR